MVSCVLLCMTFGAVLAQRYRFTILGPATVVVMIAVVSFEVVLSPTPLWGIALVAAGAASLQLGYFIGLGLEGLISAQQTGATKSFKSTRSLTRPAP